CDVFSLEKKVLQYRKILGPLHTSNVCFDITGFPVPDLFVVMKMLKLKKHDIEISIYYIEPNQYKYDMLISNNYEYSMGQLELVEIPGFGGKFDINSKVVLII